MTHSVNPAFHGTRLSAALLCAALLGTACGEGTTDSSSSNAISPDEVELLSGTYDILLQTSLGDVTLEIDANAAPLAATNFVEHTRSGYYDGLTFHRVIPNFMIQGGDPRGNGTGGESVFGAAFEDEFDNDLTMDRGAVAMANSGRNTNGSQFFIVQAPAGASYLEGVHTIFGRVTQGMEVVDAIAMVPTDASDRPLTPVTMMPNEL